MLDHGTKALSSMKGINRLVGLVDTIKVVGDKVVHGELSRHALVDQDGNVATRLEASKGSAAKKKSVSHYTSKACLLTAFTLLLTPSTPAP